MSRPAGDRVAAGRGPRTAAGIRDPVAAGRHRVRAGDPDLRMVVPALTGWALVFALLWADASTGVVAGCALVALAAAVAVLRWPGARGLGQRGLVGATAAVMGTTALALAAHDTIRATGPLRELAADQATVTIEGTVSADPRILAAHAGTAEPDVRVAVELHVDQVTGRGLQAGGSAPVLVVGDQQWSGLQWRERVRATGRLGPASSGADVVAVLRPGGGPVLLDDAGPVAGAAAVVRSRFRQATARLPPDAAGLVPALVVGDRSATPADLTEAMLATGLTHLSAVSGSNIAIVLATALTTCRALGVRRRWRPPVVAGVLAGFVVLARPEPSVLRAAVMGVVGLVGMSASRRRAGLPALGAAVVALLVWDPWLARSYGFALSTLATLGLLLFTRPWGEAIGRRMPAKVAGWGPVLAVPLAAQAMCAPVVVLLQGSVSLVSVPANLLAEPLVAPTTVGGVVVAVVAVASPELAALLAWAPALPALGIAQVARRGADLPWASLPWPGGALGAALLVGVLVVAVLAGPWTMHRIRAQPLLALGAILLAGGLAVPVRDVSWPLPGWQVVMCDVGQGDALVLSTGPGHGVLVDTGPDPALVDGCLDRLGVHVLDAVVLTHFHADHVDGLVGVLRRGGVREVLTSPVAQPAYEVDQVLAMAAAAGIAVTPVYAGDDLSWGQVRARVLWPARVVHDGSVPNNGSVVLAVRSGSTTALLLGDVEREAAAGLLGTLRRDPELSRGVDVVKVAHHGSANRQDELYAVAAGRVGLVSVGAGNDYGHPAASTLELLTGLGYRVARTDEDGDVAVARDEQGVLVVAHRGR